MPNYITNRIRVRAKDWEALKSALINDGGHVDFNKVKPMPDSVYQEDLVGSSYIPQQDLAKLGTRGQIGNGERNGTRPIQKLTPQTTKSNSTLRGLRRGQLSRSYMK